ncbi:NAD-dependent epimerase [Methanohalophilus portucalensis]|uniref:NAD-dependent epimerase n=2 Tax=Methanohalophilus portucalensis TaxID=39664 RepID=A0A1L9C4W1_9EURY|nr:NAD-dependent epimerase [Methanohalophilus portucalensis]ATU08256.1 NAD-dependent epimerase [Methanohalophilus portucalensis]OJH49572.1 NAD-dependent epimerase/dehydratase [Methanohalophilus portucalensis FDF-1]RNI13576.1 NAD-dependent epimerase [Methanohalophilus portucalensis FDF-1]SMH35352.1 UDP-glucuronate 4-epimerase [Methanohalophilus portucalensis FDF-1]
MKLLVTGTAGFIGFHLVKSLVNSGHEIIGMDSINDYYDVDLKFGRLQETGIESDEIEYNKLIVSNKFPNYRFIKLDLEDHDNINSLFESENFDVVCHLAAQAGVRYSITNPHSYIQSNIVGFLNILEGCRYNDIKHLIYASSSSVYGLNKKMPFSTQDNVDHPVSLYAASKKSNELMAHTYSHLYGIPTTGLRFFTVYGPWGRPDMAYFKFTKAIIEDKPIDVYNYGNMERDFTYVDDVVDGIMKIVDSEPPEGNNEWSCDGPNPSSSKAPYRIYNIGNNSPVNLLKFIEILESKLDKRANKIYLPMQLGDLKTTYADVEDLIRDFGYKPTTSLEQGIGEFVAWYQRVYNV